MLPHPHTQNFPKALKDARESIGMSRAKLAELAGIHAVMPRRYEEPDCKEFTRPTIETWMKLNQALGFSKVSESNDSVIDPSEKLGHALKDATIDDLVKELSRRGIKVSLQFSENY